MVDKVQSQSMVIRTSPGIRRVIMITLALILVFLFWLGLSANSTLTMMFIFAVAVLMAILIMPIVKFPPVLVVDDQGLAILTPLGNVYYSWDSFNSFVIKRADPWTTYIAFSLNSGVERPWFMRIVAPRGYDGGLFPYFEIKNDKLIQMLKGHQYRGRTKLII